MCGVEFPAMESANHRGHQIFKVVDASMEQLEGSHSKAPGQVRKKSSISRKMCSDPTAPDAVHSVPDGDGKNMANDKKTSTMSRF